MCIKRRQKDIKLKYSPEEIIFFLFTFYKAQMMDENKKTNTEIVLAEMKHNENDEQ